MVALLLPFSGLFDAIGPPYSLATIDDMPPAIAAVGNQSTALDTLIALCYLRNHRIAFVFAVIGPPLSPCYHLCGYYPCCKSRAVSPLYHYPCTIQSSLIPCCCNHQYSHFFSARTVKLSQHACSLAHVNSCPCSQWMPALHLLTFVLCFSPHFHVISNLLEYGESWPTWVLA